MGGIQLAEVVEGDLPRLMELQFAAFDTEPFHAAFYPGGNNPETRAKAAERVWKELQEDPFQRLIKCTDVDTGEIMAFARWQLYDRERPESEWKKTPDAYWCEEGRTKEVANVFLGTMFGLRQKTWEGRPYCLLAMLCTDPAWQRRGAGTALTQWGIDQAKRLGLPAYVEATVPGQPVYERLGFKPVGAMVFRKEEIDCPEDRVYITLTHPGGSEQTTP